MTKQQKENAEQRAIEKLTEMNIEDGKDMVIRFGDALPLQEPKYVSIHGTIDAPARWVEKRKDDIVSADAHVLVDRDPNDHHAEHRREQRIHGSDCRHAYPFHRDAGVRH